MANRKALKAVTAQDRAEAARLGLDTRKRYVDENSGEEKTGMAWLRQAKEFEASDVDEGILSTDVSYYLDLWLNGGADIRLVEASDYHRRAEKRGDFIFIRP